MVGPKVDKVWSAEAMDEGTQMMIARQVLNGEMGTRSVESKWILLPSMMCTAFLFEDPTLHTLFAIVLVVPARYQKNFSGYFQLLQDRVPNQLVQPLIQLRKIQKRENIVKYQQTDICDQDLMLFSLVLGMVNGSELLYSSLVDPICKINYGFRISFITYR